jgi:hypothetical protein
MSLLCILFLSLKMGVTNPYVYNGQYAGTIADPALSPIIGSVSSAAALHRCLTVAAPSSSQTFERECCKGGPWYSHR